MNLKEKNVPEIRFKEFINDGAWKRYKLNEFTSYESSSYSSNQFTEFDFSGKYPVFDANNVIAKIDDYDQEHKYISIIKDGAGVGRIELRPAKSSIIGTMGYIKNKEADIDFIYSLMSNINWKQYISGSTIPHIYYKDYGIQKFYIPKIAEQKKIGSFFQSIDYLISLNQEKLKEMQLLKKAYLSEMFPTKNELKPKRRFKGFRDDWEQCELKDITDILDGDRGKNYPSSDDFQEKGHTLFLSAANVTKNGFVFDFNQYISKEKSDLLGNGKLKVNDIVLTSRGSLGNIAWYNNKISNLIPFARINSGMLILRAKENYTPSYISQYLKSPNGKKQLDLISFGSAQPQLTKKDVSNYKIFISSKEEQTKIGNLFYTLDLLITLHQDKLNKLQELKKAYLNKMFV